MHCQKSARGTRGKDDKEARSIRLYQDGYGTVLLWRWAHRSHIGVQYPFCGLQDEHVFETVTADWPPGCSQEDLFGKGEACRVDMKVLYGSGAGGEVNGFSGCVGGAEVPKVTSIRSIRTVPWKGSIIAHIARIIGAGDKDVCPQVQFVQILRRHRPPMSWPFQLPSPYCYLPPMDHIY